MRLFDCESGSYKNLSYLNELKMKKLIVVILGFTLTFTACEKTVSIDDNKTLGKEVIKTPNIKCKNGVLFFEDQTSLDDYVYNANRMTMPELLNFEKSLGFESQKAIFESIALKEYNLQIKPYKGKTDLEMRDIPFPGHSPEYTTALKIGLIKEINESEGSYMDYNLSDRSKAVCLNKDGLVMVGNVLYFFKGNFVKNIANATLADTRELIGSDKSSSGNVIKSVLSGTYSAYANSGWVYDGKYRASIDATYVIKTAGNAQGENYATQIQGFPLTIHTNAQKKNFWGNWNQYWGEEYISGPASLHLDWGPAWNGPWNFYNGIYNDFSTNVNLASASNATLTYDPFTGVIVSNSFQYSVVTAPSNGYYRWPDKPIAFAITAALPGGCCGIVCSVTW